MRDRDAHYSSSLLQGREHLSDSQDHESSLSSYVETAGTEGWFGWRPTLEFTIPETIPEKQHKGHDTNTA
jgi:hypothetical protein